MVADDVVARSTSEDQQVEQGVGAQAVRTVHADAGAFADRVQTVHWLALVIGVLCDNLAVDVGGYAAHLVMDGGYHGNRLFGDIHIRKVMADFQDRRQAQVDGVAPQVRHVQVDVVFLRTAAPALFDFLVHAARDEIARCQIFQVGRITLHKPFTVGVAQNRAFATAAFGQQHARAGDTGGVELPELHVFQRNARTRGHAQTVASVDECIG